MAVERSSWGFYDDDEKGSPWRVALYVDIAAGDAAFEALSAIFQGHLGGNLAFTAAIAEVVAVRRAEIELDHVEGVERIAVRDYGWAAVERQADYAGTVTCAIPGHDHPGKESVSRAAVRDGPLNWAYAGRCGFATDFHYHS